MSNKQRRYYIDWWNIKKSNVYAIAALLLLLAALIGGGWWALRNDWIFATQTGVEIPKDAARLFAFEGEVRIVRAATRETILVTRETFVAAGDTVQTQSDGRAQIRMIDGSVLSVRPNSTIVIRDSRSIFGGKNVRVALDDGQLNVRTGAEQENATENVVEMSESENKLFPETDASFAARENGGEIRISRGGVETDAGGERAVIKGGEYAQVNNGKLSPKERLLEAPKHAAPTNLEQILTNFNGTAAVSFEWQRPDAAGGFTYRLEVATSPFFVSNAIIIERDSLTGQNFALANVAPGNYYWRVRATAASGQTTDWSEPWKFVVVKREAGAPFEVTDWRVESVGGKVYLVSGKTMPGAVVRVLGRETYAASDGTFRLQISTAGQDVTAEVRDEKGNRTRYFVSLNTGRAMRQ